ncbi:hypothetical protein QYH69_32195 [Paraburkholderia sp. SARCC-3016]|uniref:hypothetical protein n=1 Tax=Paraburkholderia sp. SARCC-3016 TaxID=3058611 RepID=UPI002807C666|nr:hypothetical protein [Paraburkholderia sp. SARCC-3016]MDQ7981885.1 hypothetical protein [Paraburkholderia sp. SARCC-3016]
MREIKDIIERHRLPLNDEKVTQAAIANALGLAGMKFEREVRLSDEDIVDFMIGRVAVEVKIKGAKAAIYRQLERYAEHERVASILLVTSRSMHLPALINGKPTLVASLSRGWL